MELDGLKVVHSGLDQAADDLMAIVGRIDARLQRLERRPRAAALAWIGEAQEAYSVAKAQVGGAVTEMRDLLRHTSQQVAQANSSYRAADARGARAFGG